MEIQVSNFKTYASGALVGFFDLELHGLTFAGCKCFRKGDSLWFQFPSTKSTDAAGEVRYTPIVTATTTTMRALQDGVRDQLRPLLDGVNGSERKSNAGRPAQRGFRTPEGEDLSEYRTTGKADDIPF
jgi:hypothetical protein